MNLQSSTMKAIRAHHRGGPDMLVYENAPIPSPAAGEVLLQVSAAAVTFAELTWNETWTRGGVDRTPTIPAHEVSGVVMAVGENVSTYAVDDVLYGLVPFDRNGAAAEFVVVPVDALAPKPTTIDHLTAAAAPLGALTAWQALVEHARCRPGESVLVHGGAGAVGGYVTQLARGLGAGVTATARSADAELVRTLGAETVVDFETEQFDATPGAYDVVIDTVGGTTLDRSYAVLRPGGRLITLQAPPSQEQAARFGITAVFFIVRPDSGQLRTVARMIDDRQLQVTVADTFPLARGREAYLSGTAPQRRPGKTVLVVRGDAAVDRQRNAVG